MQIVVDRQFILWYAPSSKAEQRPISNSKELRINEEIRSSVVLVIDEKGTKLGELSRSDALRLAEERNLDLVEVSPQVSPPVCKLLDYGKLRYEETRAERKAKAHQKTIEVKEIRLGLKISTHDLQLKITQAKKFLAQGNKVHVVLRMKGREQAFPDRAFQLITSMIAEIGGSVEQAPSKLGNQVTATITA